MMITQENIPTDEYKKILENIPVCCVEIVIHHNSKVLLVHRNTEPVKGEWWLVGGRVRKNERLEDAAARKAHEESGFKVKIIKKIGVYETMFEKGPFDGLKTGVHTVNVCFLAEPIDENPEVKIDRTSSEYRWIDKIEESLNPCVKEVLKDSGVFD